MHQAVLRLEGSLVQVFEESLCRKMFYAPKALFSESKVGTSVEGSGRGRLSTFADRVEKAFVRTGRLRGVMAKGAAF